MQESDVRLSVANLITQVKYPRGETQLFVVQNPNDPKKPWQSLSAGPKLLTKRAHEFFANEYQAYDFHDTDLRFRLPKNKVPEVVQFLMEDLSRINTVVDWLPRAELTARLVDNYWPGVSGVMDLGSVYGSKLSMHRSLTMQPELLPGEVRGGQGSTVRYFCFWTIELPNQKAFERFQAADVIRLITHEEALTTQTGRQVGQTEDGLALANNVGVDVS